MNEADAETLLRDGRMRPCPNPRCGGSVGPGDKSCAVCGDKLGSCPSCGKQMSVTIGRCGRCGFRIKSAPSGEASEEMLKTALPERATARGGAPGAPPVFHLEGSREEIRRAIADAYRAAALAEAEMVRTTPILERVRTSLLTEVDALQTWRMLDAEIGAADASSFRPALVSLRNWFTTELFAQQIRLLRDAFQRDAEGGWRTWLRQFAEALAQWRMSLCCALVETDLPFPESFRTPHDFRRAMRLVLHDRWPETHTLWTFLAQDESLLPHTRARLLVVAGEIHLNYFSPREKALSFFEQAQQIAPNLGRTLSALGDYYADQRDFETARSFVQRAIEAAPDRFEGYCSMGGLAQKENHFTEAESWFMEAIAKSGGDSNGYLRLLGLYGQPGWIETHEPVIERLADSAKAVEPANEYRIDLDVGDAYKTGRRLDQAHAWYDKAIALDPDCASGYMWKGFACLDEGENRYEEARAGFLKAIAVAPESYWGYWGMGQLFERQGQWAEAASQYALSAERQPEMQAGMGMRIGEMQRQLGKFSEAEHTLLEALKLDPSADAVVLGIVEDYFQKLRRPDDALRLLEAIREIKGESFAANYQNGLGNIRYFQGDYESAAQCYLHAIDLDSKQPVFVTNLADAYRQMKRWDDAREQLRKAWDLDRNQQAFDNKAAVTYGKEGDHHFANRKFDQAISCYGEAIRLMPREPRYLLRRALAFEEAMQMAPRPEELLVQALNDAQGALRLAAGSEDGGALAKECAEQVESLEHRRSFLARYGAQALSLRPAEHTIRVQAPIAALSCMVNFETNSLIKEFQERIDVMRKAILLRYGFILPGINFTDLPPSAGTAPWDWRVEILGEEVARAQIHSDQKFAISAEYAGGSSASTGQLPPMEISTEGMWLEESAWSGAALSGRELLDPPEYVARSLGATLVRNLKNLCSLDAVFFMLAQCKTAECAAIKDDPGKLVRLIQRMKDSLSKGQSVGDLSTICQAILESPAEGDPGRNDPVRPRANCEPGIDSLSVRLSPRTGLDLALLRSSLLALQTKLYRKIGIIIPQITIGDDEALGADDFQFQVGAQRLPAIQGMAQGEIFAPVPFDTLRDRFPEGRAASELQLAGPSSILKDIPELRRELEARGSIVLGQAEFLVFSFESELISRVGQLVTFDVVEFWLSRLKPAFPVLVNATRRLLGVESVTDRLRNALDKGTPIRALPILLADFLGDVPGR